MKRKMKTRTPKRIRVCPGCGKRLRDGVRVSFCEATRQPQVGVIYVRKMKP